MKKHADIQYSSLNKGFSVTALSFIAEWHLRSQSWWNLASSWIQKKSQPPVSDVKIASDVYKKHFVKVLSLLLSLKESVSKVRLHKIHLWEEEVPKDLQVCFITKYPFGKFCSGHCQQIFTELVLETEFIHFVKVQEVWHNPVCFLVKW